MSTYPIQDGTAATTGGERTPIEDGADATTGGERTTTKPKINQPQQAQNIAGSGGTWPKYQTINFKDYTTTNPRSNDQAIAFFDSTWLDFSKRNKRLRREMRSQMRTMRSITEETQVMNECGRLVEEKKKAQHISMEKVVEELENIAKK